MKKFIQVSGDALSKNFPSQYFIHIEGNEIVIHSVFDNMQDPKKRP